ncbi:DUF962 domain-containing protein [Rosistilla oblonga]|uniref:Mpo1 family 2-hydroxy fatty acid dioxygenase n=1 Tax=Rosistilla oblonga TaxID=2527990 RepID=UPI003A96F5A0
MAGKSADERFAEYELSHRNPVNKRIHWICVPVIAAAFLGLLWELPVPRQSWIAINWSIVAMLAALAFYIRMSLRLAIGMAIAFALLACGFIAYRQTLATPLWIPSLTLFVIAWIGQFIGHQIEGKKPAFFQDLQFLLIGPAWVLRDFYRRMGW